MLTDKAVLVVGGDSAARTPLMQVLRTLGLAVGAASDAADATGKFRQLRFDLAILCGDNARPATSEDAALMRLADPECKIILLERGSVTAIAPPDCVPQRR